MRSSPSPSRPPHGQDVDPAVRTRRRDLGDIAFDAQDLGDQIGQVVAGEGRLDQGDDLLAGDVLDVQLDILGLGVFDWSLDRHHALLAQQRAGILAGLQHRLNAGEGLVPLDLADG